MKSLKRIAILWPEVPQYAARLMRAAMNAFDVAIDVISTRSSLPIAGIEEILHAPVKWIQPGQTSVNWDDLGLPVPTVLMRSGWSTAAFNVLAGEARGKGVREVLLMDNPWKGTYRQHLGCAWFRLFRRRRYAAIWVPGQEAARFAGKLGFPSRQIYVGLYGADPDLFRSSEPLARRERQFIFVGQLIERKGLRVLAQALERLQRDGMRLCVDAFGTGALVEDLATVPGLHLAGFLPGDSIAKELAQSRFLVLPSLDDHWPLVVHEATCCGCGIVTTDCTGSRHELVTDRNGWICAAGSGADLARCLREAAGVSEARLREIKTESLRLSARFSPSAWVSRLGKLLTDMGYSL